MKLENTKFYPSIVTSSFEIGIFSTSTISLTHSQSTALGLPDGEAPISILIRVS
jgi:hypothetical protein